MQLSSCKKDGTGEGKSSKIMSVKTPCKIDGCVNPSRARGFCVRHYNAWYNHGDPTFEKRRLNFGVCTVAGCDKPPRSRTSPFCEACYYRNRRNGFPEKLPPTATMFIEHERGYIMVYAPDHPLATKSHVLEHRLVMYADRGGGPFDCHWCGKQVTWKTLHVDHLDGIITHNEPANLVPSCQPCNMTRGNPWEKSRRAVSPAIKFNGEDLTISQWAARLGIKSASLRLRLANGWPLERALSQLRGHTGPASTLRPHQRRAT